MHRLTFITGALVGYVLGARAGRERYEQMRQAAQKFIENPAVRNTAESAMQQGRTAAGKVGGHLPDPLGEKVRSLRNGSAPADDWGTSNT